MTKKERKVWFITRPERDPKFHLDALESLEEATDQFTQKWHGNRKMHLKYEEVLNQNKIKRDNLSVDGSGGRTWVAMLKTFSYLYTDEDGYIKTTKVGKEILNGKNIRDNISKQILTLQIPNSYFMSSGFRPKFESDFEIHPARFLIKLTNQKSLDYYITKEEITFFALKAKKNSELSKITKEILDFRKSSFQKQIEMKKDIAKEYEHRERSDKGARDFEKAHSDVSHTFMLLCDYTELVEYLRGKYIRMTPDHQKSATLKISEYESRYPFSKRYMISSERFFEHAGLDVTRYKSSPFGDISPATNRAKSLQRMRSLLAEYPSPESMQEDEIIKILSSYFSRKESEEYAGLLTANEFASLNEDFIEGFLNELDNKKFEDKCAEILKAIGFQVELRPKPTVVDARTEIEIIIHLDDENICVLDAKNYRDKFPLSANLASHMASEYIPNYHDYKGKNIYSFGYITATSKWTGESNLKKITQKLRQQSDFKDSNIQGTIISASALIGYLDYCLENDISINGRKDRFKLLFINRGFRNVSEILRST